MVIKKNRGRAGTGTLTANPEGIKTGNQAAGLDLDETPRWPESLKISELADNPDNPRDQLRRLEELARTIEEVGVLQRLVVIPRDVWLSARPHHDKPEDQGGIGEKPYVILIGHRRRHASEMAGLEEVPVDVRDNVAEQSRRNALIENLQRDDLTVMEEARELDKMMREDNLSQRAAASALGKSQGWVSQRVTLLKLVPALQLAVDAGELKIEDAREVARLLPELQQLLVTGELSVELAVHLSKLPENEQLAAPRTLPEAHVSPTDPELASSGNSVPGPRKDRGDGLAEARELLAAVKKVADLRRAMRVVEEQPEQALMIYQSLEVVMEELRTDLEGKGLIPRREEKELASEAITA